MIIIIIIIRVLTGACDSTSRLYSRISTAPHTYAVVPATVCGSWYLTEFPRHTLVHAIALIAYIKNFNVKKGFYRALICLIAAQLVC